MRQFWITAFCTLIGSSALAQSGCAGDKRLVGACFKVHGRLSVGADSWVELWPIGTKRLLGVMDIDSRAPFMPEQVEKMLTPHTEVYGDYLVCPFTQSKPRVRQYVCIESAEHIVVEPIGP